MPQFLAIYWSHCEGYDNRPRKMFSLGTGKFTPDIDTQLPMKTSLESVSRDTFEQAHGCPYSSNCRSYTSKMKMKVPKRRPAGTLTNGPMIMQFGCQHHHRWSGSSCINWIWQTFRICSQSLPQGWLLETMLHLNQEDSHHRSFLEEVYKHPSNTQLHHWFSHQLSIHSSRTSAQCPYI